MNRDGNEGSLERAYRHLYELVTFPLTFKSQLHLLHIQPPRGILIYGPSGVGKSSIVRRVADETHSRLLVVSSGDLSSVYIGEGEEKLNHFLKEAERISREQSCILFLEDLDSLCPKRELHSQVHVTRRVAQLLSWMDGTRTQDRVIVVAATQRPNGIDPALRRPGRFDREVAIELPSYSERLGLLESWKRLFDPSVDVHELAKETHGYTLADLRACIRESVFLTDRRDFPDSSKRKQLVIGSNEITKALTRIRPSIQRDTSIRVTPTSWDDIGGLDSVKQAIREVVEWPLVYREQFNLLGLTTPRGILLYGPPGCSKTTIVKVIATNCRLNFLSLHGAAIYSSYVGEAEETIRDLFRKARLSSPSIIFFDEIEAIVGKRPIGGNSRGSLGPATSSQAQERILATLLNEMDGIELSEGVLIVGATNRPDMLDHALLRPGRFDRVIYMGPPDETARLSIFRIHTRHSPLDEDVDFHQLAHKTDYYSGADIENLCREAIFKALNESISADKVRMKHFEQALVLSRPSITREQLIYYESMKRRFS